MSEANTVTGETLREVLRQLVGKTAWGSKAGSGTGSIFTLQFGAMLLDPHTQGEFSLMVYCAWRIVDAERVLLSWHNDSDGVLAPGLAVLHEHIVIAAELSKWNDLTLSFANGQELQIINDVSPFNDFDDIWNIGHNGLHFYSVKPDNTIDYELIIH